MTDPGEPTDQVLAARAAAGDQTAFAELMRRHKGWLYRFVRRYVRDAEESYDVVQESFAAAWTGLHRYDPERAFDIWLRRIALNKCRDRARKAAVRRVLFGAFAGPEEPPDVADPSTPPDEAAFARQAMGRLEAAIAVLPSGLREPLVLTALEGLSHKEAGAVLGLSVKVVELRVYRAKRQLAEQLDRDALSDLLAP